MRDQGVRSIHDLLGVMSRREVERRVATGELTRVCRGWYATVFANQKVVRALQVGGRLGCLSGCAFHGLWVPDDFKLHVAYDNGNRPRSRSGVCLHPTGKSCPKDAVWPLEDCLAQAIRHHDRETALILLESAVDKAMIGPYDVQDLVAQLPAGRRHEMRFLSEAESGSETRVRLFFQLRRVPVRPQVGLEGIGDVDLVVGDRLIVECDSDAHHRSKEEHQNDRRRDLETRMRGYDTIRLTYHQIWTDWEATQASLLQVIRERKHIRRK